MSNLSKEFSQIYDQNVEKIYRFVYLKVNSQEIAEDLTSEAFMKGWQAFKIQNGTIENVSAFLYRIARNLVTDHYRQKGQAQLVSVENMPPSSYADNSLQDKIVINSDIEQVRANLANLKEEYQDIIIWYYLEELSVSEIAQMLDKSEEAVRVVIHRALKALKSEIEGV